MQAEILAFARPQPDDKAEIRAVGLLYLAGKERLIDVPELSLRGPAATIILGPNGAGKSLLLRLLHGLIEPSAGEITGMPTRQAMVFQRPVILRRSVGSNISFALKRTALSRAGRAVRLAELLALGGLTDKATQPARTLSFGEQQRLAILRALATDPEILFLDEPTSSLDPSSTLAIEQIVARVSLGGTKVVMVTHDIGQARRLAGEVLFIHRGRVTEQTDAERFFDTPRSDAARVFLSGGLNT